MARNTPRQRHQRSPRAVWPRATQPSSPNPTARKRCAGLLLTPSGTVNDGNGGNNYAYTFVPVSTGVITPEPLTITAVADTKVYDGTTNATAATPRITSGSLATGDTADFIETYSTKVAGTGLSLTPVGTVDDGNDGNNYAYTFAPVSTGVITPIALTITAVADSKVYDGTTNAAALPMITSGSLVTGDTPEFTETYSKRNVGTGLVLTPGGTVDGGDGGADYTYSFVSASTGVITPVALTITAVANTRVYDGTTIATVAPTITSGNVAAGDTADFTESAGTKNVGTGLLLAPGGTVDDGNGGHNYNYTFVSVSAGTITPAPLTVRAKNLSSVYGSSLPALTYTITGFMGGDSLSVVTGAPVLATTAAPGANAGTYPTTVAAGSLSAANYTFPAADLIAGTLTVTPAPLVISAVSTNMLSGQAVHALTAVYTGFVNGDTSANLTTRPCSARRRLRPVGRAPIPSRLACAISPNYMITYVPGTLTVTLPPATVESVKVEKVKLSSARRCKRSCCNSARRRVVHACKVSTLTAWARCRRRSRRANRCRYPARATAHRRSR